MLTEEAWSPRVSLFFLSLSYSLFQASSHLKTQRSAVSTYLPGFLRPEREGALRLHSLGRPGGHLWPYVDGASLLFRDCIDFLCKPRNFSLFLSSIFLSATFFISLSKSFANADAVSPSFPLDPAGAGPRQKNIPSSVLNECFYCFSVVLFRLY